MHIGSLLEGYNLPQPKGKKPRSKRNEMVKEFVERINDARKKDGYEPLEPRFIAIKLSHLDTWDLSIFLGSCKEAKNFNSFFWWSLDVKTGHQ